MDRQTFEAYESGAASYAEDWASQPTPADLYVLLQRFFDLGPTIDVGCGAGRDVAWLARQGFEVQGIDASSALILEARRRFPDLIFGIDTLPELKTLGRREFQNVLCETVIMHLEEAEGLAAVKTLADLLRPGGSLYVSWRVNDLGSRDRLGRLYAAVNAEAVRNVLPQHFLRLYDQESISESSQKRVQRMVVRRLE